MSRATRTTGLPPTVEAILAEPSASNWLKDALRSAQARDPVDAARDAELLAAVLAARADASLAIQIARLGLRQPKA